MSRLDHITAVYVTISGFAMAGVWGVFYAMGFVRDEMAADPLAFWFLLSAEALTSAALAVGGIGMLAGKAWAGRLTLVALGMLLYAVVYATGVFGQRGNVLFACLFGILALVTAALVALRVFSRPG
jgi:hypothetical protein